MLNKIYKFRLILLNVINDYVLKIRPYYLTFGEGVSLGLNAFWDYDELRLGLALSIIEVGITIPLPAPKKGEKSHDTRK